MLNITIRLAKYEKLQATVVAQVARAVQLSCDERVKVLANIAITQHSRMLPTKSMITGAELSHRHRQRSCILFTPRGMY